MLGRSLLNLTKRNFGFGSRRMFGTSSLTFTQNHYKGNSVFMRQVIPSKLTVPYSEEVRFEYTVDNQQTVADFEKMVRDGS